MARKKDKDLGPLPETLPDLVRWMRLRVGVTPTELAARLDVVPATVRSWEDKGGKNYRPIQEVNLGQLAQMAGVVMLPAVRNRMLECMIEPGRRSPVVQVASE